jgi:hypothetical protein
MFPQRIEQRYLCHLVSQLSKVKYFGNYIHVQSTNSNFGKLIEGNTVHQLLEHVEAVKTVMDPTKEAKDDATS